MRSWTGPVTEISVFPTKILVIKIKNFLFEHSSLGDSVKPFFVNEIALFSLHSGKNGVIVLLCIFTSEVHVSKLPSLLVKVKNDHRGLSSNLSNWKKET